MRITLCLVGGSIAAATLAALLDLARAAGATLEVDADYTLLAAPVREKAPRVVRVKKAKKGKPVAPRVVEPPATPKAAPVKRPSAGYAAPNGEGGAWVPPADTDMGCRAQVYRAIKAGPKLSSELFVLVAPLSSASVQLALSELRLAGVVKSEQEGRDRLHSLGSGK